MSLARAQRAAASWERAVLAVHTNTTRVTGWVADRQEPVERGGRRAGRSERRRSASDRCRETRPARSSTPRWWASRFEAIPSARSSSVGEASVSARTSTMLQAAGVGQGRVHPDPTLQLG